MKLKVVSDGTIQNSKVIDAETGKELKNVSRIEIVLDAVDGITAAEVTVAGVELDLDNIMGELYEN